MDEDMKRVLEEFEQDLLNEEPQEDVPQEKKGHKEDEFDAILAKILAESEEPASLYSAAVPAFEDPDKPNISGKPVTYRNYSNAYGNNRKKGHFAAFEEENMAKKRAKKSDKWLIILMSIASVLCLGIIGVLIYWLKIFAF